MALISSWRAWVGSDMGGVGSAEGSLVGEERRGEREVFFAAIFLRRPLSPAPFVLACPAGETMAQVTSARVLTNELDDLVQNKKLVDLHVHPDGTGLGFVLADEHYGAVHPQGDQVECDLGTCRVKEGEAAKERKCSQKGGRRLVCAPLLHPAFRQDWKPEPKLANILCEGGDFKNIEHQNTQDLTLTPAVPTHLTPSLNLAIFYLPTTLLL